ncbi:MAG: hypothetical protein KA419_17505 [Acidobacteria bacterium]|nr:hypothetical protein [Acidobacteriota bacterium]
MQDFIEMQDNSLGEIVYNAMVLYRFGDLGAKIDTSLSREIKKDTDVAAEDAPLQLRLRLHNRFNMDLNNVYAMEVTTSDEAFTIETSVNVYHDDFLKANFDLVCMDVFADVLKDVNVEFALKRFDYNYTNSLNHWKAAKEKQYIIDPQVDRQKEMHDLFVNFHDQAVSQAAGLGSVRLSDFLKFQREVVLQERRLTYARSKILKIQHLGTHAGFRKLMECPQFFSVLLLEYCLVPLFLVNELYIMSLIYKRNLENIRAVLRKRVQEV